MSGRGYRAAALLAAASALTGCGFRLVGSEPLPHSLAVVRIDAVDTQSDFYYALRKSLLASGTRIAGDDADGSVTTLHIQADAATEQVLTVSSLNVPNEYELTYSVRFSVEAKGRELIAPEEHDLVRDYSFAEEQLLAKEREKSILSEALARDLATVVMRRLASLQ